ncbi:MAG: phage tail sheath subtilisin-like domain-containing protein [Myxococcaceae bacterium]
MLGAPGIYRVPREPARTLVAERMDVAAFAGVTERGPARFPLFGPERPRWMTPPDEDGEADTLFERKLQRRSLAVPVESWSEFERLFGGYAGPGRLPYAVASYFENGGTRAYVVRIVEPLAGLDRFAFADCSGLNRGTTPARLYARDPGSWGNALALRLTMSTRPLPLSSATMTAVEVDGASRITTGALLRLRYPGGRENRFVVDCEPTRAGTLLLSLDQAALAVPQSAELVEGALEAGEGEFDNGIRHELHQGLGFHPDHPRWLAKVLYEESALLLPGPDWLESQLTIDVKLPVLDLSPKLAGPNHFQGGEDDYQVLTPEAFFGSWFAGEPLQYEGVHCLAENEEIATLCAPDLYQPEPLSPFLQVEPDGGTAEFSDCAPITPLPPQTGLQDLPLLRLDPVADLELIAGLQGRLVDLADQLRGPVVLLDVPPRLRLNQVLAWRSHFDSAFAAAYHPWVKVPLQQPGRPGLVLLNPSAIAAGVIAQVTQSFGVPFGPANVLAQGVVDLAALVDPKDHDRLHPLGVNVFTWERDGARLSAARTLSADADYRQLSVRRLVTQLERTLTHQLQWVVFEPNGKKLRTDLTRMISALLSGLYKQGAFTGANEGEAFFVKCDDELNPPRVTDEGKLIAHVGVAPAEPLEFIVLTVALEAGAISVEG